MWNTSPLCSMAFAWLLNHHYPIIWRHSASLEIIIPSTDVYVTFPDRDDSKSNLNQWKRFKFLYRQIRDLEMAMVTIPIEWEAYSRKFLLKSWRHQVEIEQEQERISKIVIDVSSHLNIWSVIFDPCNDCCPTVQCDPREWSMLWKLGNMIFHTYLHWSHFQITPLFFNYVSPLIKNFFDHP